jgi:hypothetical protein
MDALQIIVGDHRPTKINRIGGISCPDLADFLMHSQLRTLSATHYTPVRLVILSLANIGLCPCLDWTDARGDRINFRHPLDL